MVNMNSPTEAPTGCAYCLDRLAGRRRALCPSHGDEWEVGRREWSREDHADDVADTPDERA